MKANNLSICVPSLRDDIFSCNKNCPYCVSKMTGVGKGQVAGDRFWRNIIKTKKMAVLSQVNSVILTGKSEPLMNMEAVELICKNFYGFPLEVQTNGILLNEKNLNLLEDWGVDTIAVSVDSHHQLQAMGPTFKQMHDMGFNVRMTVNLVDAFLLTVDFNSFESFIEYCKENKVDQLSFRKITIPHQAIDTVESKKTQDWITENIDSDKADEFLKDFQQSLINSDKANFVQALPFGARVYMYDGVSCTSFNYCIQDTNNWDDIRSLIYYEDGHLATTWYGSNHGRIL